MKFKAHAKQNQLLERISTQHIVVGIDIAQQSHVARAVNFRGILLGTPLHFSNDDTGFSQLLQWIKNLQETHRLSDVFSQINNPCLRLYFLRTAGCVRRLPVVTR